MLGAGVRAFGRAGVRAHTRVVHVVLVCVLCVRMGRRRGNAWRVLPRARAGVHACLMRMLRCGAGNGPSVC